MPDSYEITMNFRIPDFPLGALLAVVLCATGLLFISPETSSMWLWEALIAIAFIVWALGAGFFHKSKKQPETADKIIDENACGHLSVKDKNGDVSTQISALIGVIREEGIANRREERKEDDEGRLREQITIVFIGITMFAIILQVHEMVKAYEPIHDQAKAAVDQAKAAVKQADAAVIQAQGVKDQIENAKITAADAHQDIVQSQRAWVGPIGATIEGPAIGSEVKITVNLENTGRQPAFDLFQQLDVFVAAADGMTDAGAANERIFKNVRDCQTIDLIPGSQVVYPSSGFGTGGAQVSRKLEARKIDSSVMSGESTIYATGCFAYRTFERTRFSAFCFFYKAKQTTTPNLNFCNIGAYAN